MVWRTIVFREDGTFVCDKPEVIPNNLWGFGDYVYRMAGVAFEEGWYTRSFCAGRAGIPKEQRLEDDEVPKNIRMQLLLIK